MLAANRQPEFVNPESIELAKERIRSAEEKSFECMKKIRERVNKDCAKE